MGGGHWEPGMEFCTAEIKAVRVMIAPSRALGKSSIKGSGSMCLCHAGGRCVYMYKVPHTAVHRPQLRSIM